MFVFDMLWLQYFKWMNILVDKEKLQKEKAEQPRRSGNETQTKKALAAATEISDDLVCDFTQVSP